MSSISSFLPRPSTARKAIIQNNISCYLLRTHLLGSYKQRASFLLLQQSPGSRMTPLASLTLSSLSLELREGPYSLPLFSRDYLPFLGVLFLLKHYFLQLAEQDSARVLISCFLILIPNLLLSSFPRHKLLSLCAEQVSARKSGCPLSLSYFINRVSPIVVIVKQRNYMIVRPCSINWAKTPLVPKAVSGSGMVVIW